MADVKRNPASLGALERWMRDQKPEELFDQDGRLIRELKELAPTGTRRMSANLLQMGAGSEKPYGFPTFDRIGSKSISPGRLKPRTHGLSVLSFAT